MPMKNTDEINNTPYDKKFQGMNSFKSFGKSASSSDYGIKIESKNKLQERLLVIFAFKKMIDEALAKEETLDHFVKVFKDNDIACDSSGYDAAQILDLFKFSMSNNQPTNQYIDKMKINLLNEMAKKDSGHNIPDPQDFDFNIPLEKNQPGNLKQALPKETLKKLDTINETQSWNRSDNTIEKNTNMPNTKLDTANTINLLSNYSLNLSESIFPFEPKKVISEFDSTKDNKSNFNIENDSNQLIKSRKNEPITQYVTNCNSVNENKFFDFRANLSEERKFSNESDKLNHAATYDLTLAKRHSAGHTNQVQTYSEGKVKKSPGK